MKNDKLAFLFVLIVIISISCNVGNQRINKLNKKGGKTGVWVIKDDSFNLCTFCTYKSNKLNGKYTVFYPNGKIAEKGKYKQGKKHGKFYVFTRTGILKNISLYKEDSLIDRTIYIYFPNW